MSISKSYWLWGLFPSKEKVFLNEIKAEVQRKRSANLKRAGAK